MGFFKDLANVAVGVGKIATGLDDDDSDRHYVHIREMEGREQSSAIERSIDAESSSGNDQTESSN